MKLIMENWNTYLTEEENIPTEQLLEEGLRQQLAKFIAAAGLGMALGSAQAGEITNVPDLGTLTKSEVSAAADGLKMLMRGIRGGNWEPAPGEQEALVTTAQGLKSIAKAPRGTGIDFAELNNDQQFWLQTVLPAIRDARAEKSGEVAGFPSAHELPPKPKSPS